ncbi:acetylornithine deacetylase [Anseongella ginsenosidimutans]|uniref:Acetylornithine deacetylase n=1 Tax=Anseongella ginsenosidimutans TaxID=496056 RepID=A0A4V2UU50_9SPHI|nr:M20 family metallo-hydrolase [Anseongella ginsenosidimutans]QEC51750.1 M20/M25/M40 family metallo-hydrolase [Anseongella ginsenosidimutans]TCS89113.1 acetylornithine deacetylase [Anseongella ginsenosidimutans]
MTEELYQDAIRLLKTLIGIPSQSRQEEGTADAIEQFFREKVVQPERKLNNIWVRNKYFSAKKPTILLNSHHDTVKPAGAYTLDPYQPLEKDGKLYGLGSNDAGGALVSLIAAFLHFYDKKNLKYNLLLAATAEEEISGKNGIELVYPEFGPVAFAIVGEPTEMHLAISEKGLMVLDCQVQGRPGHAARDEGENAIYNALRDIEWFRQYQFAKVSEYLGPVKMSVTVIKAGSQHNVVPDLCEFTVDVRTTDAYTNEEILKIIRQHVRCSVKPRSVRLRASSIEKEHPIVKAGEKLGRKTYGSPTTSDQALLPVPSFKMGPGDSARSHSADEFIFLDEIKEGIPLYVKLLDSVL